MDRVIALPTTSFATSSIRTIKKYIPFLSVNSMLRKQSMFIKYSKAFAIIFLIFCNHCALASQFTPISTDVKIITGQDSDILVTVTPNSEQISYSKLSTFYIDRPLKIINTSDAHGINNGKVAKLIIINADNINLRNSIELIGETADILLISNNSTYHMSCYC